MTPMNAPYAPPRHYPNYPMPQYPYPVQYPPREPVFAVRLMKHTGLVMLFLNQQYTVTGTYAQCEAAIRQAQIHNLTAGWWSMLSVVAMNWIALGVNFSARA